MHRYVGRPQITIPAARRVARPVVVARTITRRPMPVVQRPSPALSNLEIPQDFGPDPFVDYRRSLTPEGGILLTYKDLDLRFRHFLWGGLAWSLFTGLESYTLVTNATMFETWGLYCCALAIGLANWLIVGKPVEIYRRLEIRPDCMIIDGDEVFWARNMEHEWPGLEMKTDGEYMFQGVYGSRFVEFLTVRRFDENDRTPELFASHFKDAVEQLWEQKAK